jgi:hypothetical protein
MNISSWDDLTLRDPRRRLHAPTRDFDSRSAPSLSLHRKAMSQKNCRNRVSQMWTVSAGSVKTETRYKRVVPTRGAEKVRHVDGT